MKPDRSDRWEDAPRSHRASSDATGVGDADRNDLDAEPGGFPIRTSPRGTSAAHASTSKLTTAATAITCKGGVRLSGARPIRTAPPDCWRVTYRRQ